MLYNIYSKKSSTQDIFKEDMSMFVWRVRIKEYNNVMYNKKIETLWFLGIIPLYIRITDLY